ncbi:MAG: GH3 auxin-responsive promoter family protein [Rikenellaceae bacterium]
MSIINKLVGIYYNKRRTEIDFFKRNPLECVDMQLKQLLQCCEQTSYLKERGIKASSSYEEYASRVPIVTYEDFVTEIESVMNGDWQRLCPSRPDWYAKSSGTTNAASKFIPTTYESMKNIHFKGFNDVVATYNALYPTGGAFFGKSLTLGGSLSFSPNSGGGKVGDLSGILIENTPSLFEIIRFPSKAITLDANFEEKISKIAKISENQNITSFAGVPSWYMVLMNLILDYTGKKNMCEVWPNIDFFAHGGIKFSPYKDEFNRLFPSSDMKYMETYNASEGFFAIGDDPSRDDMLLMLDYQMYYEFMEQTPQQKVVPLEGVEVGKNYAIIISTSGGLYRYMIGDTVTFTSTDPYRIKISGRTKHYINVVGEELIVDNAEEAIMSACNITSASVKDYTAAPIFMQSHRKAGHEWIFEFNNMPSSVDRFISVLDDTLMRLNSDYRAKRVGGALDTPKVLIAGRNTFYNWMKSRGKLGGQNKIPRLSNDRKYIDSLLSIM